MEQSIGDFALFMKRIGTELVARSGVNVGDLTKIVDVYSRHRHEARAEIKYTYAQLST